MIGRRSPQQILFNASGLFSFELRPGSFHGQLAQAAPRLFRDEEFLEFYSSTTGRPSVPPSQLALLMLLQHEAGVSDQEAVERSGCDLRWSLILNLEPGEALCVKSTLQLFRSHLILHEKVRLIFQKSIQEAKGKGLLKAGPLTIALDTKPILGRGAVEDTYNLLATGIEQLCRALAKEAGQERREWMHSQGMERYLAPSIKGTAGIDWSDEEQRNRFLSGIVADAGKVLMLAKVATGGYSEAGTAAVKEAASLLAQLFMQDVERTPVKDLDAKDPAAKDPIPPKKPQATKMAQPEAAQPEAAQPEAAQPEVEQPEAAQPEVEQPEAAQPEVEQPEAEQPQYRVKQGTAPDRMPSATDPEQRHGCKSKSHRFKGYKASVATDVNSKIITAVDVLFGNDPDARDALELTEQSERNTEQEVCLTLGDCAYGGGGTRQAFADAKRELVAKVPAEADRGVYPKSTFTIDLLNNAVRCPGEQTTHTFTNSANGGKTFYFGSVCNECALKTQCTTGSHGRTLHVHPQEALLKQARTLQNSEEGRAILLQRQAIEHRLARLGQLGIGQALYKGRVKIGFQLLVVSAIANFRRTWNWQQERREEPVTARGRQNAAEITPSIGAQTASNGLRSVTNPCRRSILALWNVQASSYILLAVRWHLGWLSLAHPYSRSY